MAGRRLVYCGNCDRDVLEWIARGPGWPYIYSEAQLSTSSTRHLDGSPTREGRPIPACACRGGEPLNYQIREVS